MDNAGVVVMFFLIFGGGTMVNKLWSSYNKTRIEIAKIKASKQSPSAGSSYELELMRNDLAAMRQELHALRDTSTQYDISFDTALQRMESRVEHVERRQVNYGSDNNKNAEAVSLTSRMG